MRGLQSFGFGRIHTAAEIHTNDDGNKFLQMVVEFEHRLLQKSGKLYQQRVLFRSFDVLDQERCNDLTEDRYVVIDGLVDAVAEKSPTGWWYANPRVTGRIHQILDTDQHG